MSDLSIRAVEARPVPLPLSRPISSALGTYEEMDCVAVQVHTTDGPSGFGYTMGLGGHWSAAVAAYIEQELAPRAVGADPLAPERVWQQMWAPNKPRMRAGLGVWALSAVDIACWDILGKVADLPLHTLLGGYRRDVPVYGSGGWHDLTDDELVAECEAFAAKGIDAYKYKIGSPRDRERTALLRRVMGEDFILLADANQGFTVREAVEASRMLADHGVAWIEEPVLADTVADLADVARRSAVPTAAGENLYLRWGFRELCETRGADYLQPDIVRCGGVTEFRKIAAVADAYNVALSSHLCHELSISLVGASPRGWRVEYAELLPPETFTAPFVVTGGTMRVPDVPGHGVAFSDDVYRRAARD